ncbi:MAG: YihY/virulence factor BrkB family protein [Candidatus Kapabacteria bacterium]|nr:YihY/virulence factor BrkB family protein [Candidatus Kapabacteria bacterium]MDW7997587.1 YhjD/YihY/BrkB family envelope integrity protein [Bacteroidota bacterium]
MGYREGWRLLRWRVRWLGRLMGRVASRLVQQHVYLLAAGIAFNVALCFFPLGLVALWLFAGFVSPDGVETALNRVLIAPLLPSESLQRAVSSAVQQLELVLQRRSTVGVIGLVTLLWTASALLQSLRTGLHAVFQRPVVPTRTFFLWARLRDMLFTVVLLGLTLLVSLMLVGWSMLTAWGTGLLPWGWRGAVQWLLGTATSVILEIALFGFVFRFVPAFRLPGRMVLFAVASSVMLTELLRVGYVWYLENMAPWGWVYGGYAALVSLAIWAYAVAFIMLLSGTVSAELMEKTVNGQP